MVKLFDDDDDDEDDAQVVTGPSRGCTSLDHCWPIRRTGTTPKGTPCYCGRRQWGIEYKPKHTP